MRTIIGNLVATPNLYQTQTGKTVTTITVGVNRPNREPEFIKIRLWEQLARAAATLPKGIRLIIEGPSFQHEWTTQDGTQIVETRYDAYSFGVDLTYWEHTGNYQKRERIVQENNPHPIYI